MENLPVKNNNYSVALNASEIAEELEGLGSISLDIVKVPTGGGIMFEIPSDNPDQPDMVKDLTGVIVDHHAVNSYWAGAYTGENIAPSCMSVDGKQGKELASGEFHDCNTCPYNQFGSKGEGKACKNSHRLYLLREGDSIPFIINVPPSSLKGLKEYLAKRVILKHRKLSNVITQLTLSRAKNKGGIVYSQIQFSKVGEISAEAENELQSIKDLVKVIGRRFPVAEEATAVQSFDQPLASSNNAPFQQYDNQAGATFQEVDDLDNF